MCYTYAVYFEKSTLSHDVEIERLNFIGETYVENSKHLSVEYSWFDDNIVVVNC